MTASKLFFVPLDRNTKARIKYLSQRVEAQTRTKGKQGDLKKTGLAVLEVLLFRFHNATTGRCDPTWDTIAAAAGCSREALGRALKALEGAGILARIRRAVWVRRGGVRRLVQTSNAYSFSIPAMFRGSESESRPRTTTESKTGAPAPQPAPLSADLQSVLTRLGEAILARQAAEKPA